MDFVTRPRPKSSSRKILWVTAITCCVLVLVFIAFMVLSSKDERDPQENTLKTQPKDRIVPADVSQKVPFPVYYPNAGKLPAGYTLDRSSFSTNGEVVVYSISYQDGKKVAFTLQKKPSDDQLKIFYKNQIPLRTEAKTPLGTAAVSAMNNQRFLSLPIEPDVWLIATAPIDIDPAILEEIAKQVTRAE